MKKIKKFKINLRPREILRLLKKTTKIADTASDLEEKVESEAKRLQKSISPAAIYETVKKDEFPFELRVQEPANWVAATSYSVTIGDAIEKELRENRENDTNEMITHSVALEGIDQAVNFIQRLIREEAAGEDCEISKELEMNSKDLIKKVFSIIPGDKIGISLSEDGNLNPQYSQSGIIYWVPVKKRK